MIFTEGGEETDAGAGAGNGWHGRGSSDTRFPRVGMRDGRRDIGAMGGGFVARTMIEAGKIWLAWEPVDMRAGIDLLSGWIQESLARSPCDGTAYVFRNRSGNRMKLLLWGGNGGWLCRKRLAWLGLCPGTKISGGKSCPVPASVPPARHAPSRQTG